MTEPAPPIAKAALLHRLHTDPELLVLVNIWDVASECLGIDSRPTS